MSTTEEDEEKEHRKKFEALSEHLSLEAHREHLAHKHQPDHDKNPTVRNNSNPYTNGLYYMELNYVERPVPEVKIPMVVSKWTPVVKEAQTEIKFIPMWVILKIVPTKMFSSGGIGFLASPVWGPKCIHPDIAECKHFEKAKVFVEVDLSTELLKSFRFKSDKGVDAIVEYVYPWLPPRFTTCSKWGHLMEDFIANKSSKQPVVIKEKNMKTKETGHGLEEEVLRSVELEKVKEDESLTKQGEILRIEIISFALVCSVLNQKVTSAKNLNSISELVLEAESQTHGSDHLDEEDSWKQVSREKTGKHIEKGVNNRDNDIVSPSRFSILANVIEEKEETNQNTTIKEVLEKREEQDVRPSLPRSSKSAHKYLEDSSAQITAKLSNLEKI